MAPDCSKTHVRHLFVVPGQELTKNLKPEMLIEAIGRGIEWWGQPDGGAVAGTWARSASEESVGGFNTAGDGATSALFPCKGIAPLLPWNRLNTA